MLFVFQPKRLSASSSNMVLSRPVICRMPSYSDCVNQELENVFICEGWGREEEKVQTHTGFSESFPLCKTFVIIYVFVLLVQALEVRDGGRAPVPPLHHTHSAETQISCSPCYCCSPPADAEKGSARSVPVPWCCPLTPLCALLFSQNVYKEDLLKQTLDLSSQITGVVHLCLSFPALPNPTTVTRLNVSLLRAARKSKCLKISCKYH